MRMYCVYPIALMLCHCTVYFRGIYLGVTVIVTNHHASALDVTVTLPIPLFLDPLLHTAYLCTEVSPSEDCSHELMLLLDYPSTIYQPSFDLSPHSANSVPAMLSTLSWMVSQSPNSTSTVSLRFIKRFLTSESLPPDASRGMDFPAAFAYYEYVNCSQDRTCTATDDKYCIMSSKETFYTADGVAYAQPFTVTLPIPDSSMPYNVITLVSSLAAFLFGSMVNTLVKKSSKKNNINSKYKIFTLLRKLIGRIFTINFLKNLD